jgi:hypothetical protein
VFITGIHYNSSLILVGKAGFHLNGNPYQSHSNSRLLALPGNISLVWMAMAVANTLAYYDIATITAVKSFILQNTVACTIKRFTAVIVAIL